MTKIDSIIDKVDADLLRLIDANETFTTYREITSTVSRDNIALRGSLGIEINPKRTLGVAIYSRG
ncbi:hypothetical protein HFO93_01215 [Rhizobium leguminosarum]|uniref:hypothetical protein n=1 Tax=Rhizobium leguminosarum TaxID=384 RepID=UPI001C96EF07|nr:hypothetical protein [Rhizobium leguminosarum]MBY5442126.1 hypothetical protein [Rhizobium leguminosarum]